MAEEIRQVEALSDAERARLFGWGDDIFGAAGLGLSWRQKDSHFILDADGEPVSHVGILKHEVSVGGQPVVVGGVGGVVTVPAAQGRGYAGRLMRRTARFFAEEWKTEAGLLFCLPRMVPYYEALGWKVVEGTVLVEQPTRRIASPLRVMTLSFGGRAWPDGEVELRSLPW